MRDGKGEWEGEKRDWIERRMEEKRKVKVEYHRD